MNENDREIALRDEYNFTDARRGPIMPPTPGKTRIMIRLDNDILDGFRGKNWSSPLHKST